MVEEIPESDGPLKFEVVFNSNNYGVVACNIKITDGVALAFFSDRRLARDMYLVERELKIDDVYFKERLSCLGTRYPNLKKEEIAKIIVDKFEKHNAIFKK
jgi:hypothetical protein